MSKRSVPKWVNAMMKFMLKSPFHSSVSQSIMLITFTGRKTGKRYSTPIRYMRSADKVIAFTQEKWWKNLQGGKTVELRLAGQQVRGIALPIEGRATPIDGHLQEFLGRFPEDAKYYAIKMDETNKANPDDLVNASQNTIMLEIQLDTRS